MTAELGAHETMELHEVITDTVDGINQFELYRPHVKNPQLLSMLDNQIRFMTEEYNNMVQSVTQHTSVQNIPYRGVKNTAPAYGLNNPSPNAPNISPREMDNKDVASGMLGCHKASAKLRMEASLEFADPSLRRTLQQGAINCSEQAFEVWNFMNQQGLYQVPTMKQTTTNTMINSFNTTQMPPMS
ncbi:MAG: spore coat protein [Firmicutes bacterium]|nr:spore coat protein [Bacillota bacterium]